MSNTGPNRSERLRRRDLLAGTATAVVVGFAGCSGGGGGGCDSGEFTVTGPDDSSYCVAAVESDSSVVDYYGFNSSVTDSASTPDELAANDAAVTFVYENTSTGDRSLVMILGDGRTQSDGGGGVAATFEGISGYAWQVRDGPHGTGSGDRDPYQTPNGEFEASESVAWGWNDSRTDGGAFGPLGDSFEITATLRAEGTVGDVTRTRNGLDRWLFINGADLESPIELTGIGDDGDISVELSTNG